MKKLILLAVAFLLVVASVSAQTPAEKEASADRIATLKVQAPGQCDVSQVDLLVVKCKSIAEGTVAIADMTANLQGNVSPEVLKSLLKKIEKSGSELGEAAGLLTNASLALKQLRNPLRIRPATKCISYAKKVIEAATKELPYQGKVVNSFFKKK